MRRVYLSLFIPDTSENSVEFFLSIPRLEDLDKTCTWPRVRPRQRQVARKYIFDILFLGTARCGLDRPIGALQKLVVLLVVEVDGLVAN
jgi:hypothetical protein